MDTKKTGLLGIFLVIFFLPFTAFAGIRDDRSSEVQGMYTLFLGSGVSLAYNLGNHLAFGGNFYAASYEGDGESDESNETVEAKFSTSELFIRVFPFEGSGFYVSGASVFRNWEITVTGNDLIGDSGVSANYELTAEWPTTGYSYGLGFNWIADFGLSGGLFLGAISGGDPELKGKVDNAAISQADIDKEIDEIEEDEKFGEKYNTVALVRFSIGYNF